VAFGASALGYLTTTSLNTAFGLIAGIFKIDASNNTNQTNCTYLGYDTRCSGDNQVQVGGSATTVYAYGAVQNRSDARDKTDIQDTTLGLDFINELHPVDFKWNYRESYDVVTFDENQDPKLYKLPKDGSKKRNRYHHGLIAQEVKQTLDKLGIDFGGYQDHKINGGCDVLSLGYTELIAPLIKAVQELSAKVITLETQLDMIYSDQINNTQTWLDSRKK
jgi:hypothetical protein